MDLDDFDEYDGCGPVPKDMCPNCGEGTHGVDALCEDCWKEYLGTHMGGR